MPLAEMLAPAGAALGIAPDVLANAVATQRAHSPESAAGNHSHKNAKKTSFDHNGRAGV